MSFEGVEHRLCENGHLCVRCADPWDSFGLHETCETCGGRFVWAYTEDQTNGINKEDPMNNGQFASHLKTQAEYETHQVVRKSDGTVLREFTALAKEETYTVPTTFGHVIV